METASNIIGGFVAALAILAALLCSGFATLDHFAGTYGMSIGTNSSYCSIEDKLPVITCEHAN